MAAEIVSIVFLNVRLADYSVRNDTIQEVVNFFKQVTDTLTSLAVLSAESPQVLIQTVNFIRQLVSISHRCRISWHLY